MIVILSGLSEDKEMKENPGFSLSQSLYLSHNVDRFANAN